MARFRVLPLLVLIALAIFLVACGGGANTFRGNVVDVQATDILQWDSITVRNPAGQELTFARGPQIDLRFWRASHLRDHMEMGLPVTVTYKNEGGKLVAINLQD